MKGKTIRQRVVISATPNEVYEAFVDPKKHSKFTGSKATFDPRVGGEFTAWDGYISGKNLELKEGKRIVQEWQTTEWPKGFPPSRLELALKKIKETLKSRWFILGFLLNKLKTLPKVGMNFIGNL